MTARFLASHHISLNGVLIIMKYLLYLLVALLMVACTLKEKEPTLQDRAENFAKSLIIAEYGVEGYVPVSTVIDTMFIVGKPVTPEPGWTSLDSLTRVPPIVPGSVIRSAPTDVEAKLRAEISGIDSYEIAHRYKIMGENGIYTYSTFIIEANKDLTEGNIYDRVDFAYSDR